MRAFVRLVPFATCSALLAACAGAAPPPKAPPPAASAASNAPTFSEDPTKVGKFHSKRFALTLPLPDGRSWRIDDHSHPYLDATHAATRSELQLETYLAPEAMSRQKCEERARQMGLVPAVELHTVEDQATVGPEAFDTRIWVAIAPGTTDDAPIVGHLFAFGAYVRKCLYVHYTTSVAAGSEEAALSSRLADARVAILRGITTDDFDSVPRVQVK